MEGGRDEIFDRKVRARGSLGLRFWGAQLGFNCV
jgi:hypothetical protein